MQLKTWLPALLLTGVGAFALVAAKHPAPGVLAEEPAAGTYEIDTVHSTVIFRIQHIGVSYAYGSFEKMKGEIKLDGDASACHVFVEIDANSIDTNNNDRDNHLRGPDFLNVAEFPTLTFESTKVRKSGGKYAITGNLECHGETKEVSFEMNLIGAKDVGARMGGYKAGFEGKLTIDRNDFGIKTYPDALGKEIELTLSIEAAKK